MTMTRIEGNSGKGGRVYPIHTEKRHVYPIHIEKKSYCIGAWEIRPGQSYANIVAGNISIPANTTWKMKNLKIKEEAEDRR